MSDWCDLKKRYCTSGQFYSCSAKACPKGYRSKMVEKTSEERQTNRLVKEGAKKWKGWL